MATWFTNIHNCLQIGAINRNCVSSIVETRYSNYDRIIDEQPSHFRVVSFHIYIYSSSIRLLLSTFSFMYIYFIFIPLNRFRVTCSHGSVIALAPIPNENPNRSPFIGIILQTVASSVPRGGRGKQKGWSGHY